MKKLMVACSAVACLLTAFAGDTAWTWPSDGTGDSVTNMANWATAANWNNGVPQTANDNAKFTNAFTGVKYVFVPENVTIRSLFGKNGSAGFGAANRQIVVSDSVLSLRPTGTVGMSRYMDIYGTVSLPSGGGYFTEVTVAGDLVDGWVNLDQSLYHRLDLYANAPGGTRRDFLPYGIIRESWGNYVLYAPKGSSTAIVGQWTSIEGCKYLFRTGAKHDIPVGTTIHGSGIPDGAWVKRVFTDAVIEISAAATATVEGGDITFDPLEVDVYEHITEASRSGAGENFIILNKFRSEDILRLEIDTMPENTAGPFIFRTSAGYYPGTHVLRNVTGSKRDVRLENCHLEFAPTTNGGVPGMLNQGVRMTSAAHTARLTVTNNIAATIRTITNLVGTVVKDGAGRLQADLSQSASRNTGRLVVEAGEFKVVCGAGDAYVKTLAISNGASVSVSGGNLKVDELIVEPGAKIRGPGHILYGKVTTWPAETFEDGGSVDYVGPGATVNYSNVAPAPSVVGTPALWMDVAAKGTVTYDAGTLKVSELRDVRGEGYPVAAVASGFAMPNLVTNADGSAQHIYFERIETAGAPRQSLKWDTGFDNIRVIFKVLCAATSGGGCLLGSTTGRRDFWRDEWKTAYSDILFFTGTGDGGNNESVRPSRITNGVFYVNGELRDWHNGFAYKGGKTGKTPNQYIPQVAEYHVPAPGGWADCFSYITGGTCRGGNERLYEVIVYTNELTEAERQSVAGYLMKKYRLGEVDCSGSEKGLTFETLDVSDGTAVGVGEGAALRVNATTGDGALVKQGAGTLYVDEFANDAASLKVEGGKMTIRAVKLDSSTADADAYLHLDALNEDSITMDGNYLKTWKDTRGAGYLTLTNFNGNVATITNNCVNGKRMVDLNGSEGSRTFVRVLAYEGCADLRSVFLVTGTRKYGGALIGHTQSPIQFYKGNQLYGLWRRACGRYGKGTIGNQGETLITSVEGYSSDWVPGCSGPGATRARINGEYVDPCAEDFTHKGDITSFVTREDIYGDCLSCVVEYSGATFYWGAQQLGEYLLFRESLSQERARRIEAYLRQKWFGEETVGYRAPKAASVSVAAGATLELVGGAPITVGALDGAGTISGAVKLAANTVFEVEVADDGSVPLLTVSGAADLSAGGTVRLTGAVRKLAVGSFPILAATPGFDPAVLANWTLIVDGEPRRILSLGVVDGKIVLKSERFGAMLLVR